MFNSKCVALFCVIFAIVAAMPSPVVAQTKAEWATFFKDLYVKDAVLNSVGLGQFSVLPNANLGLGDWSGAFNWATPYLSGFGRRLMGSQE